MKLLLVILVIELITSCGQENSSQEKIIGGKKIDQNAVNRTFPGVVAVYKNGKPHCGGALVTRNRIISAAHCFKGDHNQYTFVIGHSKPSANLAVKAQSITIYDSYSHHRNDFAIVKLKHFVSTRPFPINGSPSFPFRNTQVLVLGWGAEKLGGGMVKQLKKVDLEVISNEECQQKMKGFYKIEDSMLCTHKPNKDACDGDSGGPLLASYQNQWVIVGLVSFGLGCANRYPGVFTRVSSFIDMIKDH